MEEARLIFPSPDSASTKSIQQKHKVTHHLISSHHIPPPCYTFPTVPFFLFKLIYILLSSVSAAELF